MTVSRSLDLIERKGLGGYTPTQPTSATRQDTVVDEGSVVAGLILQRELLTKNVQSRTLSKQILENYADGQVGTALLRFGSDDVRSKLAVSRVGLTQAESSAPRNRVKARTDLDKASEVIATTYMLREIGQRVT